MVEGSELAALQREIRQLRAVVLALILGVAAGIAIAATSAPDVVRATGLVIVDGHGRERILLGSPVPSSPDRNRIGGETSSLVFLSPEGSDRVIVGQDPQPQIQGEVGHRIAESWGLTIHDPRGAERGGIGFLGDDRAAVALDYPTHDAIGMVVDDKTRAARMFLAYPPELGAPQAAADLQTLNGKVGLQLNDPKGVSQARLPLIPDRHDE